MVEFESSKVKNLQKLHFRSTVINFGLIFIPSFDKNIADLEKNDELPSIP